MKLMIRMGAVVGLALTMLITGCNRAEVKDDRAGADREGDFSKQGEPNPPKKKD